MDRLHGQAQPSQGPTGSSCNTPPGFPPELGALMNAATERVVVDEEQNDDESTGGHFVQAHARPSSRPE